MRSPSAGRLLSWILVCAALSASPGVPSAGAEDSGREVKTAPAWTEYKSGWTGHGVGSMVHRKTTQYMAGRKMQAEEKKTLVKITDQHFVLKVERKNMLGWKTTTENEPKVKHLDLAKAKAVDVGEETLTIEGKPYLCTKCEAKDAAVLIPDGMKPPTARPGRGGTGFTGEGVLWFHKKLGMLKMEMSSTLGGRTVKTNMIVTRLGVEKAVGDKKVRCRETKITNSRMTGSFIQFSSEQVPGGMVRSEMSFDGGGMRMGRVEELIAWVKKPALPPTTR